MVLAGKGGKAAKKAKKKREAQRDERRLAAKASYDQSQKMCKTLLEEYDINGNGTLDKYELKEMMVKLNGGKMPPQSDVETVLAQCDSCGDGKLDATELETVIPLWMALIKERVYISSVFDKYDKDNSGGLTEAELRLFLADLNQGEEPSDEEIQYVITQAELKASRNGAADGVVGRSELTAAVEMW